MYEIIGQLKSICETYHDRLCNLENDKYDMELLVRAKDIQVHKKKQTKTILQKKNIHYVFEIKSKSENKINIIFLIYKIIN